MAGQHIADQLAEEIVAWLDSTAEAVADALRGSPFSPQVVQTTAEERLDYFRAQLFNPDGTPNLAGRDHVLRQYGPDTYETVALALAKEG